MDRLYRRSLLVPLRPVLHIYSSIWTPSSLVGLDSTILPTLSRSLFAGFDLSYVSISHEYLRSLLYYVDKFISLILTPPPLSPSVLIPVLYLSVDSVIWMCLRSLQRLNLTKSASHRGNIGSRFETIKDHVDGKMQCGFGIQSDSLREPSYQRHDSNFVMLMPNKEHQAEDIIGKMGERPMLKSDIDAGNFDGLPIKLKPLDKIL
ncbi:plant/K24A2-2 protein [Senna tora]|uniref:Plant/K24A2-2 protein n=1 Tax=Senna tora TaxID=362788 RepID=A0A834XDA9_9FABA|nr:plant/K24A2-2 protein [Senna tora]